MPLQTLSARDTNAILDTLQEDGAVILQNLFANDLAARLCADIESALHQVAWCNTDREGYGADFFGRKTKRLHGVLQYSELVRDCMLHPLPMSLAESWIGHKPHFSTGEIMAIGPGERQQTLHRDATSWAKSGLPGELLFSMTIALTDFTQENGATVVAPGSHRWPDDYRAPPEAFTSAQMSRGSVLLYSGNVLHSGGANQTARARIGLYLGYIPFWLQPLENPATTHPPGFLDGLDAQTRNFLNHHPGGFSALLG